MEFTPIVVAVIGVLSGAVTGQRISGSLGCVTDRLQSPSERVRRGCANRRLMMMPLTRSARRLRIWRTGVTFGVVKPLSLTSSTTSIRR